MLKRSSNHQILHKDFVKNSHYLEYSYLVWLTDFFVKQNQYSF